MVMQWLENGMRRWGLAGVFVVSFLSSTLLPGVSEVAVVGLVAAGVCRLWPLLITASVGNWLGSVVTYAAGWYGSDWLMSLLGMEGGVSADVRQWVDDYGSLCGFLAWLPGVGDFLVLGLGLAKTPVVPTCLFLLIGKAVRYAVLLGLVKTVCDAVRNFINKRKRHKKEIQECTTT